MFEITTGLACSWAASGLKTARAQTVGLNSSEENFLYSVIQ